MTRLASKSYKKSRIVVNSESIWHEPIWQLKEVAANPAQPHDARKAARAGIAALESQLAENTELRAVMEQIREHLNPNPDGVPSKDLYAVLKDLYAVRTILASVVPVSPEKEAGN